MRYQSTTGLSHDQINELVQRVHQILSTRRILGRPTVLGLYHQVLLVLVLLRQNLSQFMAAEMFGISQPTVSRIFNRMSPILLKVIALVDLPPLIAYKSIDSPSAIE